MARRSRLRKPWIANSPWLLADSSARSSAHLSCLLGGRVSVLTLIFPLRVKMPFSSRLAYVLLRFLRTRFTIAVTPPITASIF
jgi:hypothetical protein